MGALRKNRKLKKTQEITLHGTRPLLSNPCCSTGEILIRNNIPPLARTESISCWAPCPERCCTAQETLLSPVRAPQQHYQNILLSASLSCHLSQGQVAALPDEQQNWTPLHSASPGARPLLRQQELVCPIKADSQFTLVSLVERI